MICLEKATCLSVGAQNRGSRQAVLPGAEGKIHDEGFSPLLVFRRNTVSIKQEQATIKKE